MGFRFDNNRSVCRIDIEGNIYSVAVNEKLQGKITGIKASLDMIKSSNDENAVIMAADSSIDVILGQGSSEKIFGGRERSAYERLSVLTYIFEEITAFTDRLRGGGNVYKAQGHNRNRRRKNSR